MQFVMFLCYMLFVQGHTHSGGGDRKSRTTQINSLSDSKTHDNQVNINVNGVPQKAFRTNKQRQGDKHIGINSNTKKQLQISTSVYKNPTTERLKHSEKLPKRQLQTKNRNMFRGSRRRPKARHQSVKSQSRLKAKIGINSRNYLKDRVNKTVKQPINTTSASPLLLPDTEPLRRQNMTTSPIVSGTLEQQNPMPLLQLFSNNLDKIKNEKRKQEIRNHLTIIYAMKDVNHFRLLVHQMRHVRKIAQLNIKGDDLKPLVKDVIVKSGIMTKAYIGVSPDFNAMINKITAEFSYRKGAYWTHISTGISDMMCGLCKHQRDRKCVVRLCTDYNKISTTPTTTTKTTTLPPRQRRRPR